MLKNILLIGGVVLLGVAIVFGGYGLIMWHAFNGEGENAMASRGQFGDMFGALNAIFSTLAFAALGTGLYLQHLDLRKQDERHAKELDLATLNCYVASYPDIMRRLQETIEMSLKALQGTHLGTGYAEQKEKHEALVRSMTAAMTRETDTFNDALLLIKGRVEEIINTSGKRATRNLKAYYGEDGSTVQSPESQPVKPRHKKS